MKVLLCVAVLLTGALAAPSIDQEQHVNDALAEANMHLSIAAVAMDSDVEKRGVCSPYRMRMVGMCMIGIARTIQSKAAGLSPCGIRTLMINEMNSCAREYGCEDNMQIRNAIQTGVRRFDQSMRAYGVTC